MPSPAVIERNFIKLGIPNAGFTTAASAGAVPAFGGTSTAGTGFGGIPAAGHQTRSLATGHLYTNLASGGNVWMPACPGVNRQPLEEYFLQKPALNAVLDTTGASSSAALIAYTIANKNFEVLGTNMTTALATFAAGGGVVLTTAGASNDQAIVLPHLDTNQTSWTSMTWKTDDQLTFETTIKSGAGIVTQKLFAGLKLTNTPLAATDNDQAYFLFDTGNTDGASAANWIAVTSRSGTDTFVDTGVPVVAATSYNLVIQIDVNRIPYFFINDVLVAVGNGTKLTGVTTSAGALTTAVSLIPYVGVQALAAAARTVTVRNIKMAKSLND